jgi:hypothetical protein
MRIQSWTGRSRSLLRAVLLLVMCWSVHAAAGVKIERFGYFKDVFPAGPNTSFIDDFDGGGPLVNLAGSFQWQVKIGSIEDEDEVGGDLRLKPAWRGGAFNIGPYAVTGQVLELQTPLTGSAAINNQPDSNFFVFAMYELGYTMRDDIVAGVGLTDVFRGGTRGIAATVGREDGKYYGKFSDAVTGNILDKRFLDVPAGATYLELFIGREHTNSDSVISGYALRDASFNFVTLPTRFNGVQIAFSDVVLSPVLFAAVVPEPRTWALMIAGLAFVAYRASRQARARR